MNSEVRIRQRIHIWHWQCVWQQDWTGIRNEIMPPESVDTNIYKLTQKERERMGIDSLPGSLLEAAREFEKDTFIKDVLGKELAENTLRRRKKSTDNTALRLQNGKFRNISV